MHDAWSYGLAIVTFILLLVAAVYIAWYDQCAHYHKKRVRFDLPEESAGQNISQGLPLGFGAL
jgi:hypothetical protein